MKNLFLCSALGLALVTVLVRGDSNSDICAWLSGYSGKTWKLIDSKKPEFCDTTANLSTLILEEAISNAFRWGAPIGKCSRWASLEVLFLPKFFITGNDGVTKEYMCRTPKVADMLNRTMENVAAVNSMQSEDLLSTLQCDACAEVRSMAGYATAPQVYFQVFNDLDVDVTIVSVGEMGEDLTTDTIHPADTEEIIQSRGVAVRSNLGTANRFEDPEGNCLGTLLVTASVTQRISRLGCVMGEQDLGTREICHRCEYASELKSENSKVPSIVDFVNYLSETVKVYWVDYAGNQREYISEIKPGESVRQNSFVTHHWLVKTMSGECVNGFLTPRGLSTARIGICDHNSPHPWQGNTGTNDSVADAPTICGRCDDQNLKSPTSSTPSMIRFDNKYSTPVNIYWIDTEGTMIPKISTLSVGASVSVASWVGHTWKATNLGGECLGAYVAQFNQSRAEVATCYYGDAMILSGLSTYIRGEVWEDSNLDGMVDLGEPKLRGVSVHLRSQQSDGTMGPITSTAVTDSYGKYRFDGVDPTIRSWIEFERYQDREFTKRIIITDRYESDADAITGLSQPILLEPGQPGQRINAGVRPLSTPAPIPPSEPNTPAGCSQNNCMQWGGNVDYTVTGNSMSRDADDLDTPDCEASILSRSSSAQLTIPTGAKVLTAFLQWSGSGALQPRAKWVTFSGPGLSPTRINAALSWQKSMPGQNAFSIWNSQGSGLAYLTRVDVAQYISGSGEYTVSDFWAEELDATNSTRTCESGSAYGAWSLFVVYEKADLPLARVRLCGGTDRFYYMYPAGTKGWNMYCVGPSAKNRRARLTLIGFAGNAYVGDDLYVDGKHQGYNLFRGSNGPNFDIVTRDLSNHNFQNDKIFIMFNTYEVQTKYGIAVDGFFAPTHILFFTI